MTDTAGSPVRSGKEPIVADILTAAFTGDPFFAWLFRDPETHVRSQSIWWHWLIANASPRASIWRIGKVAAALWQPPLPELREGDEPDHAPFIEMVAGLVGDRIGEVLSMFRLIADGYPEGPYWYLSSVGSLPQVQGHGHGARVLGPVLEICDQQGLPAYLESSNPRNLAFYHRLGFEITGEITSLDNEVSVTQMWRTPR